MKPTTLRALTANILFLAIAAPVALMSFQNCAPKSFSSGQSATDSTVNPLGSPTPSPTGTPTTCEVPSDCVVDPTKTFALLPHTVRTEMDQEKEWTAPNNGEKSPYHISLASTAALNTVTVPDKGTVVITDASAFTLKFTPVVGYLGSFTLPLHALDSSGKVKSSVEVTIVVGSALNYFQPALAVRGAGCVMCHSDVRSNIVTDFGYGNNFYFGKNADDSGLSWNFGAAYGDFEAFYTLKTSPELGNWAHLNQQADKKVYVPKNAPIPVDEAKTKTGATTLAGYLTQRLSASDYSTTRTANKVVEKSTVYIGAPTADRIKAVFGWSSGMANYIYRKDSASGAYDLSGLRDAGAYFTADGTLTCDGDLMINGTVYFNNLNVRTHTGCRLYVTRSVFIYGAITYDNVTNSDLRNLQITSASAILMGLGDLYNGSTHCEVSANTAYNWYYDRLQAYNTEKHYYSGTDLTNYNQAMRDSAYMRLVFFWPNANNFTRDARSPIAVGQEIYTEMRNSVGLPKDASCRSGGRGVSYSRLFLNAPRVESRYNGDFSGSIVAEYSLMALGQFKFQFDEVFTKVKILPVLKDTDYLHIE